MATTQTAPRASSATANHPIASAPLTVTVPVVARTDRLRALLDSLDALGITHTVVADNGTTSDRADLYDREYAFDLTVLDLDQSVGIGEARAAAVDAADTEFILTVDADMVVDAGIWRLVDLLEERPELGAAAAHLIEHGTLRAGATDLHEDRLLGGRRAIVHEIRDEKPIRSVGGIPFATFDKLPNAAVMRRSCLAEYGWDPELKDRDHLDLYLGHYHQTDWTFASVPSVTIEHHPDRDGAYADQHRQHSDEALDLLLDKWGYDKLVWGDARWCYSGRVPTAERAGKLLHAVLPTRYAEPLTTVGEAVIGR